MAVDTSMYQSAAGPDRSIADYQQQYQGLAANALNLQSQRQKLDAYTQDQAEKASLRNYLQSAPDLSTASGYNGLMAAAPTLGPGIHKNYQDSITSAALANKDNGAAAESQQKVKDQAFEHYKNALGTIQSPDEAERFITAAYHDPIIGPELQQHGTLEQGLALLRQKAATPDGFKDWLNMSSVGLQKIAEATKVNQINKGGTTDTQTFNPYTGKTATVASAPVTVSPDAALTARTSRQNTAATIAGENVRAGVKADGTPIDGAGLSEQARIAAATRYRLDGTLPAGIGRGTQGARDTRAILDEAASQSAAAGDTPEAARIAQIANKANSAALSKLQTQQTMVGAFEKNFNKNADIADQLFDKVDNTGVPIVNKWINAGKRSIAGDPDIAALDASVKATVNEYAKIVSGATGSAGAAQGEITKIESLLNDAQSRPAAKAVLNLMRKETQNRMAAFDDEKSQLTSSMIHPGSKPAPSTAGGVPADVQAILDKHLPKAK